MVLQGLPFPQTGPEWRLVYRAMGKVLVARAFLTEVMQLPVQDVADSKEQAVRAHLGPGGEPPAVCRGVQHPHGPHWRPGGPGGGEGQLALQHEAVVGRRSPRLRVPSIYRKLGYIRPRGGEGDEGIVYPPITADNVDGVVGKDYRKKNYPVEMKHVFWAHMEPRGNSSRRQKGRPGGLHVQVL